MTEKNALVILAEGAEEMETVIVVDVLRRASISVTLASLADDLTITCSRSVKIVADCLLKDVSNDIFDAVILPGGGPGANALASSSVVGQILHRHNTEGKIIAAVCAAPTAFQKHDINKGKRLTSYPAFREKLSEDYDYVDDARVVVDGNMVTSRGPGTSFEFAFKLVEILVNAKVADELKCQTLALTG